MSSMLLEYIHSKSTFMKGDVFNQAQSALPLACHKTQDNRSYGYANVFTYGARAHLYTHRCDHASMELATKILHELACTAGTLHRHKDGLGSP